MNGYPLKLIGLKARNIMGITTEEIELDNTLVARALKGQLRSFEELCFEIPESGLFLRPGNGR